VRTLVISDLHLGARLGRDVLRRPAALAALLEALADVDRLVLLGDTVELLAERGGGSPALARPVLEAIGRRIGAHGEIVLVPGNHDAALIRPWLRAHGVPNEVDAQLPLDATPLLADVSSWLGPARLRVRYPGVWLSSRVWATHGHYLDRHLLPEGAFGVTRGLLGRLPRDGATPADYERRHASVTAVEGWLGRWLPRPLAALAEDVAELLRAATMTPDFLSHRHAPLTSRLLGMQMRRAAIPALARVVHRLGIDADWVVFGHVHRNGPTATDDPRQWTGPGGRPRIANTGSWVYEPLLLHRATPPHPYWPGGAIVIEDAGDPEAIGLLDAVVFQL
jgi:UDP-2,3-diacylglucosamine pyrophosphatase LpxH